MRYLTILSLPVCLFLVVQGSGWEKQALIIRHAARGSYIHYTRVKCRDMPLKAEPRLIMEEFDRLFGKGEEGPESCGTQLQTFISTWFIEAGSDTVAVSVDQRGGPSWRSELVASLLKLLRRAKASSESSIRSTLLPAPNPFIIPGERFRESYYWDSYWIILALLKTKDPHHLTVAEVGWC